MVFGSVVIAWFHSFKEAFWEGRGPAQASAGGVDNKAGRARPSVLQGRPDPDPQIAGYSLLSAISSCLRSASSRPTSFLSILAETSSGNSSSSSSWMWRLTISSSTRTLAS